jgi:hypothetical protein
MVSYHMVTSEQVRAARALLRWEQKDLAGASMVSLPSIQRLETKPGPLAAQARTVAAIVAALEAAGVEFTNGGQPGVRMKPIFVHSEQGSGRLLFVRSGSNLPDGKWDGGRPIGGALPKLVRLNEHGWFVWEPTEENRRLAAILYPADDGS